MAGCNCFSGLWLGRNDPLFHYFHLSDALHEMESQPHLGMAYPFSAGNTLVVSLASPETEMVSKAYHGCIVAISGNDVFPATNLPLVGGAVVSDFVDADGDDFKYWI